MRYSKKGFTLVELITVMIICSVLLYVGTRSVSNYIDQERFQKTVVEMEQIQKALFGDEATVTLGKRAEFGYWGDNAAWPANGAALSALEPYMDVEAARSGEITTDAWGNTYIVASAASTWTLSSRGKGGAVGGIEEYADIDLVIDKDDWENNIVAIYVQDSRGTLLLGADDSNPPYLSNGHLAAVRFNEHGGGSLTWHKNSAGLTHVNGFFYGTSINAGPCSVVVTIANGDGSGGPGNPYYGDHYDWRNELTGGVDTYQQSFVIYPIGDSGKPNVLTIKLPGVAFSGINEV
jgi:prepilin-type N-terminal cleavage/methylation domain-containing protein